MSCLKTIKFQKTILRIQENLDTIKDTIRRVENDAIAGPWFLSLAKGKKKISQLVEETRQLMEPFAQEFNELQKKDHH